MLEFGFCFGDDFNFFVCTNNQITLYDIKLSRQKAKTLKQIPLPVSDQIIGAFFEPMANALVLVDNRAQVNVYFLNLYKNTGKTNKPMRPRQFNLDVSLIDHREVQAPGSL